MPENLIELECPSCAQLLEIDSGFAGGICRCSNCGTLMTVPAPQSSERPERLSRPDRPEGPPTPTSGGRPGKMANRPAPNVTADDDHSDLIMVESEDEGEDESPEATQDLTVDRPLPRANALPTAAGPVTYVTSSGRSVEVNEQAVPTARKRRRRMVRATTIIIGLLGMASVVAVCFYAISMIIAPAGDDDLLNVDHSDRYGVVDLNVNPFKSEKPNFIGVPLAGRTVIAIDGSGYSQSWFSLIADATSWTVVQAGPKRHVQIALWKEEGPQAYPASIRHLDRVERVRLRQKLKMQFASGAAQLLPAMELALSSKPLQVILVTSQPTTADQVRAVQELIESKEFKVRIDVVAISAEIPELKELANSNLGNYVSVPMKSIDRWFSEWEREADQDTLAAVFDEGDGTIKVGPDEPFGTWQPAADQPAGTPDGAAAPAAPASTAGSAAAPQAPASDGAEPSLVAPASTPKPGENGAVLGN